MSGDQKPASLSLYMRYRDVAAAVDWLTGTLGFEKHTILSGPGGEVLHAELKFGRGIIMIGPIRDSDFDRLFRQPEEIGGHETQSCYLTCDDADAVYQRAKAAGAEIVLEVEGDEAGRRGFTCRDPQGHIWSIGTYDPWQGAPVVESAGAETEAGPESKPGLLSGLPFGRAARMAAIAGLGTAAALYGLLMVLPATSSLRHFIAGAPAETAAVPMPPPTETGALPQISEAAEAEKREMVQTLTAVRSALGEEREKRTAAEQAAEKAKAELARAAEASRVAMDALRAEGVRKERERANSEEALRKARETLDAEKKTREAAEHASKSAESALAAEKKARIAAEAELEEAMSTIAAKAPGLKGASGPKEASLAPTTELPSTTSATTELPSSGASVAQPEAQPSSTAAKPSAATGEQAKPKAAEAPRKKPKPVQRAASKSSGSSSKGKSSYIPPPSFGTP